MHPLCPHGADLTTCTDCDQDLDRATIAGLRHELAREGVGGDLVVRDFIATVWAEPLPACGPFGGPLEPCGCVERCIGCGSLPGERWRGCHSREDAGCVYGTDSTGCAIHDGASRDGHHEGDAPLVIGWGL